MIHYKYHWMTGLLMFLILQAMYRTSYAQNGDRCGTTVDPSQVIKLPESRESVNSTQFLIKLYIHRVNYSNGIEGRSWSSIYNLVDAMSDFFAPHDICFVVIGQREIYNTLLANISDVYDPLLETVPILESASMRGDAMDVFVFPGEFGGMSYGIPAGSISVGAGISNKAVWAHEMGHALGLYHTHETGLGLEFVLRINCSSAGDLLCDTPADPNLENRTTNCVYNGNLRDPFGYLYEPDEKNIMSYTEPSSCLEYFSTGQVGRMKGMLLNANILRNLQVLTPNVNLANRNINRGEIYEVAKNRLTALGTGVWEYAITKNAKVSFQASNEIKLAIGFRASPGTNGSFLATTEGFYCGSGTSNLESSGSGENRKVETHTQSLEAREGGYLQEEFKIFPNPSFSKATISFTLSEAQEVNLQIRNSVGQIIAQPLMNERKSAGNHQLSFNSSHLSRGVYFCILKYGNKSQTKKMIISK